MACSPFSRISYEKLSIDHCEISRALSCLREEKILYIIFLCVTRLHGLNECLQARNVAKLSTPEGTKMKFKIATEPHNVPSGGRDEILAKTHKRKGNLMPSHHCQRSKTRKFFHDT